MGYGASLMKVFMPYLVWNTVFDNTRVTAELGKRPVPFSEYCYPLAEVQPRESVRIQVPALAGGSGRIGRMMDFMLEAWVSSSIERAKAAWMLGARQALAAGREAQTAVRRIQRDAQHGLGRAGGRDAAPDPAHSRRGASGVQRDEPEFRFLARIFRGHEAGPSARYFSAVSGG